MHIKNFDPYDFSKKVVGGIPVYYKNLPWSPCIHIQLVFSVGAFKDPAGLEGMAHFLEHMIGAGCPSLPNKKAVKEFNRQYMLNSRNAYTSHNSTVYTCKCLPENFDKVITCFMEQVSEPFLRSEDTENERKIITQEAWGRYKNEKFLRFVKEIIQISYPKNQRSRIASPLGWPETVRKIEDVDLKKFHKENYTKANFSVFLVGAVEMKHFSILGKLLKNMPYGKKAVVKEGNIEKPLKNRVEKTGEEIGDPREQLEFAISRFMKKLSERERTIANMSASLLYDILFERLRTEHSLCYGVSVPFSAFKESAELGISVETSLDKLELVEKEIWSVIDEIIKGKWEDRFNVVHKLTIEKIRSSEFLSNDVMGYGVKTFIFNGKIRNLKQIIKENKKVTYKDVSGYLKNTFDKKYVITEVILPTKK